MTLPSERSRAVVYARKFLQDLLDPKKTPKVPKVIRQRALDVLRHYPWDMDINKSALKLPDIWDCIEDQDA